MSSLYSKMKPRLPPGAVLVNVGERVEAGMLVWCSLGEWKRLESGGYEHKATHNPKIRFPSMWELPGQNKGGW